MSRDWASDVREMHVKFGFLDTIRGRDGDDAWMRELLEFRKRFLTEEYRETMEAGTAEDFVDGLLDLCVVAIGTLDLFGIDPHESWDRIHRANMAKEAGVKATRPNALGFPDLTKPSGWTAPDHSGLTGLLAGLFGPVDEPV